MLICLYLARLSRIAQQRKRGSGGGKYNEDEIWGENRKWEGRRMWKRDRRDKKKKESKTSEWRRGGGFLQTPLSSFPLEARSCKVTVGLQFWQTGES